MVYFLNEKFRLMLLLVSFVIVNPGNDVVCYRFLFTLFKTVIEFRNLFQRKTWTYGGIPGKSLTVTTIIVSLRKMGTELRNLFLWFSTIF